MKLIISPSFLERRALDHSEDEIFEASFVLMQPLDEEVNARRIIIFHAAPGGINEEFFRNAAVEIIAPLISEDRLQARDIMKLLSSDELASALDFLPIFLRAVLADGIEILQAQPNGIHALMTARAERILPVHLHHLAHRQRPITPMCSFL